MNKSDCAIIFHPYVEEAKDDAFFPDTIENLRKTATPVPLIIGMTNKEGRMAFAIISNNLLEMLQNGFSEIIKRPYNTSDLDFQIMCERIKRQYLGDELANNKIVEKVADLLMTQGQMTISRVILVSIRSKGRFPLFSFEKFTSNGSGAGHADELPYLFYPRRMLPNLNEFCEPETTVIKNMCSLWTNFAKTSNPTENTEGPEWRRFTSEKPCFLRIDKDLELIEEKLREKEFAFWNELL